MSGSLSSRRLLRGGVALLLPLLLALEGGLTAGDTSYFELASRDRLSTCELGSGRQLSGEDHRLTEASGRPGVQLDGNTSLSFTARDADDPMTGALTEVTLALWIHPDSVPLYPVYFERVTNGGRGNPGFFYFYSQTRRGHPQERETDLRFAMTAPDGERRLAVSTQRWKMGQGEWRHVACVLKDGVVSFYLDGQPLGDPVPFGETEVPMISKPVYLRSGLQFPGVLAGFLMTPHALDATVMAALHDTSSLPPETRQTLP